MRDIHYYKWETDSGDLRCGMMSERDMTWGNPAICTLSDGSLMQTYVSPEKLTEIDKEEFDSIADKGGLNYVRPRSIHIEDY